MLAKETPKYYTLIWLNMAVLKMAKKFLIYIEVIFAFPNLSNEDKEFIKESLWKSHNINEFYDKIQRYLWAGGRGSSNLEIVAKNRFE